MPLKNTSIIFDLDGTLIDTAPDLLKALNHSLVKVDCPSVNMNEIRNIIGRGAKYMLTTSLAKNSIDLDKIDIEKLISEFLEYYEFNIARYSQPFPGAIQLLQHLKSLNAKIAICTNKKEKLAKKLINELELSHFFELIIGGDRFDVCKPDPKHLLGTIELMDGDPYKSLMIGDSASDINAAKALEIPVIAVNFGYTETPVEQLFPTKTINHFDELYDIIDNFFLQSNNT